MQATASSLRILVRGSVDSEGMADDLAVPDSPVRTPKTITRAAANLRVEDVYKSSRDDDSESFSLTREDSFRQSDAPRKQDSVRQSGVTTKRIDAKTQISTKDDSFKNDPARRSQLTEEEDLSSYEEFRFDYKADSEEKEEEPLPQKTSSTSTRDEPSMDEARIRELLLAFLQVHEPRAIIDGRLDGLLAWARERGVPKLRMALKEKYRADLMFPQKSGRLGAISEAEDNSEKRLLRAKAWGSFLKFRPRKESS